MVCDICGCDKVHVMEYEFPSNIVTTTSCKRCGAMLEQKLRSRGEE